MSTEPQLELTVANNGEPSHDDRKGWLSVTRILKLAGLSPWQDVTLEMLRRGIQHGLDESTLRYILQGVRPEVLDAKAELGGLVHQAIADIEGGMMEHWWEDLEITPYVTAYLRFKEASGYKARSWEQTVYNDTYRYRGTYDSLGDCGPYEVLLDAKTTVQMAGDLRLQLAAYDLCLQPNPQRKRFGLQLKKDGSYQIHEYRDRQDARIFLAAVTVAYTKGLL